MITLSKYFSREHTFFFFYVWCASEHHGLEKWLGKNIENMLCWREGAVDKMSAWYDLKELDYVEVLIGKKAREDESWHAKLIIELDRHWKVLQPYYDGKKKIRDVDELSDFYQHFVKWWTPMALNFLTPSVKDISRKVADRALERRSIDEEYSYILDKPFIDYWNSKQSKYKELLHVISPPEAIELATSGLSDSKLREIRKRRDGFGYLNEKIYLNDELPVALEEEGLVLEKIEAEEGVEAVKGSSASPGKVRGKACVVLLKEQMKKFKENEVLVVEMTDPDFVPIMKKSAAIVTDEGGVTCHAAIVSRELGKPCVVGTGNATQVLKDGDEVEVDANHGVVTVVKRVKK